MIDYLGSKLPDSKEDTYCGFESNIYQPLIINLLCLLL